MQKITTAAVHVHILHSPVLKKKKSCMLRYTGHANFSTTKADVFPLTCCSLLMSPKSRSWTDGQKMTQPLKWDVVCIAGARASKVQQEHDPKAQHGTGSMLKKDHSLSLP